MELIESYINGLLVRKIVAGFFVCWSQQYCFICEIFGGTEKRLAVTYRKDYIDFCVLARPKKLTPKYLGAIVL